MNILSFTQAAIISCCALATGSAAAAAACSAQSAAEREHLVELYTSNGCSSCPPAERWLSKLRDQPALVGLEYHVDYWDSEQWRDPYADARFTARQKQLVRQNGGRVQVYTPQIAVDGHVWTDWPKSKPPLSTATDVPKLALQVERGQPLRARVTADPAAAGGYRLFVALAENGLSNTVTGGENRGAKLENDHVVRAFAGPLPPDRADVELTVPAGADLARSTVVAFAQNERSGDIAQVVRVPLATCGEAP